MASSLTENEKIQAYRRAHFEDGGTGQPKADKIMEWSLLTIAAELTAIHMQLSMIKSKMK